MIFKRLFIFFLFSNLLALGQASTKIHFEFGYNYNFLSHDYLNEIFEYSNTTIAESSPNHEVIQDYSMIENPKGFSMGMSAKLSGMLKVGVAFNWKRNESTQVRREILYPENISNSLHRVRMGNIQVHASVYPFYNSPFSFGFSTELGRYSIKSIEFSGPTEDILKDGSWDNNHKSWHTWFSAYLNIELLANQTMGLQIRPYFSYALFMTDLDGYERNVYTYFSSTPEFNNNIVRPTHFGVTALITLGFDVDKM